MFGYADSVSFSLKPNLENYQKGIYQINGLLSYREKKINLEFKLNSGLSAHTYGNVNWVSGMGSTATGEPAGNSAGNSNVAGENARSAIQQHTIGLELLRELDFKSSFLSCRIILFANSLKAFENVPGADNEKLILQIPRKEKGNAHSIVSRIQADIAEIRLNRLSDE